MLDQPYHSSTLGGGGKQEDLEFEPGWATRLYLK